MYKVIVKFADLKDNGHVYEVGDEYPRSGYETNEDRVKFLASDENKLRTPVIELVEKEAPKKRSSKKTTK